jgi:hypothetical protein
VRRYNPDWIGDSEVEDPHSYLDSVCGGPHGFVAVQYDSRTGIAYSRLSGTDWITEQEIDWLGLGPDGEHSK